MNIEPLNINPLSFKHRRFPKGISLIEMMIGVAVFTAVLGGAFKGYTSLTNTTINTQKDIKTSQKQLSFNKQLQYEIENAFPIKDMPYDDVVLPATGTFIPSGTAPQILRPSTCAPGTENADAMAWGLLPFPGQTLASFVAESIAKVDPLVWDSPSEKVVNNAAIDKDLDFSDATLFDGFRITYIARKAEPVPLSLQLDLTNYPTDNGAPIVVDDASEFSIGDYAIILDTTRSDFIRITNIVPSVIAAGKFDITHDQTSIWNLDPNDFDFAYGQNFGGALIVKAGISTYMFDPASLSIVKDTHVFDDDFNPATQAFDGDPNTLCTNAAPDGNGLSHCFEKVLPNVEGMRLLYTMKKRESDGVIETTRTPRAGIYDRLYTESENCNNQLGYPTLKNVSVEIFSEGILNQGASTFGQKPLSVTQAFNPLSLNVSPANTLSTGPLRNYSAGAYTMTQRVFTPPTGGGSGTGGTPPPGGGL